MRSIHLILATLSLNFLSLQAEPFYFFEPPQHWKLVDASKLSKNVKIACVAPSKKNFKPSLNLAIEKINVPLADYIQAVKKQHTITNRNKWTEIGYVTTRSGKAHIAQIDSKKAECGHVKIMQSILVKDDYAFILTAVALKEDFLDYHNQFLKAFESMEVCGDLITSVKDPQKQALLAKSLSGLQAQLKTFQTSHSNLSNAEAIKHKSFIKSSLKPLETLISKDFHDQGQAWQLQANKEIITLLQKS